MFSVNDVRQIQKKYDFPANMRMDRALSNRVNQEQTNGFINANGDYSDSPTRFIVKPTTIDTYYHVFRMMVSIRTAGKLNSGYYGNNISLVNGIKMYVNGDGIPQDLITLTFVPIIRTADWQIYSYDLSLSDFGTGDNYASVRWTFAKGGLPIALQGWNNQRLEILLEDDFTDLEHHYFYVQGVRFDRNFTEAG